MSKDVIKGSTAVALFVALVGLNLIKKTLRIDSRLKGVKSIKDSKTIKVKVDIKEE